MASFYRSLSIILLAFSSTTLSAQEKSHSHIDPHYHKHSEKLKKNQHSDSEVLDYLNTEEDDDDRGEDPECQEALQHILTKTRNILETYPCNESVSIHRLLHVLKQEASSRISLDCSILPQLFEPNKNLATREREKRPLLQFYVNPNVSWELYNNPRSGTGCFDFSYTFVRYAQNDPKTINDTIGTVCGINNYTSDKHTLSQLSFSMAFPENILGITVGQYGLSSIDGTLYDNDQQSGFISYALSQNATSTYSSGSIGFFVQTNPIPSINIQAGLQDAYNLKGTSFNVSNVMKTKYNFYGYMAWAPQSRCGSGQYSILAYATRSVPSQPVKTKGWSINVGQHLGQKLYLFGRYNGSTGDVKNVSRSYVLGAASANPINRNPQDLLGIAGAISKVNPKVIQGNIRKYESVVEAFATVGFGPYVSLTPDVQIFIHPAQQPNRRLSKVYSIRANFSV